MKKIIAVILTIHSFISVGYCGKNSGAQPCESTPATHSCLIPTGVTSTTTRNPDGQVATILVPTFKWLPVEANCTGQFSRLSDGTGDYLAGKSPCGTRTFFPPSLCIRSWSDTEDCGSPQAVLCNAPE